MSQNKRKYRLNTDDVNSVNRFIAGINRQELNGRDLMILSNERIAVKAVLLDSNTDSVKIDIDATNGVQLTGRQLRDLLENKLESGITIETNSGEIVRIYQETATEIRADVEQTLGSPSSVPPAPVPAVA